MTAAQHGEIAKRAYSLWEIEGRPSGRELDHWLRAEAEMLAVSTDLATMVPEVSVKPRRPARKRARRIN